jgi:hypothetical protein
MRVNEGLAVRLPAAGHEIRTLQALLLLAHAHVETTMIYPVTTLSRGTGLTWHACHQGHPTSGAEPAGPFQGGEGDETRGIRPHQPAFDAP